MTTGNSSWRGGWGRLGFSPLIAGGIAWLIWHFGDQIGQHTTLTKSLAFAGALFLLLMLRHGKTISLAIRQGWHRFQSRRKNVLSADEGRVKQTVPRNVTVDTIRLAMRNLYGRHRGRKTRILLITGTAVEVEQLTPGLTAQLWQEDSGTLLLWGGDLNTPADNAWLIVLRKLRRRPVDGLVWVTSAFDQLSALGLELPQPVPSESIMDTLAHAISGRMDALGWKLPLYVWSLHPRAGQPEGRIVQATGCLLPDTGARNVDSLLSQQILPVLSQQLLTHMAAKQKPHSLTLGWNDEEGIGLEFSGAAER